MYKLRPHQKAAHSAVIKEFKKANRATVVLPPGSGKTFTSYKIHESVKSDLTVFICPSIDLVYQSLVAWSEYGLAAEVFALSSGKMSDEDKDTLAALGQYDVICTSNGAELTRAVRQSPFQCVVFTTYQSARKLCLAGLTPDLVVYDEAHHLAGFKDKGWTALVDSKNFPDAKRLFLTATPRTFRYADKKVVDMDDVSAFGKHVYKMSVTEATDKGILVPIQIVLADVDAQKRKGVHDKDVAIAAMSKAITSYKLKRGLSFHNRVIDAQDFAVRANKYRKSLNAHAMSAANSADERKAAIKSLDNGKGVIANVRLFNEGFDYTALDYVMLTEPKYSAVEVTQIVGRVMRRHKGKKVGTVVLPISSSSALKAKSFDGTLELLWHILSADDSLITYSNPQIAHAKVKDFFKKKVKYNGQANLSKKVLNAVQQAMTLHRMKMLSPLEKHGKLVDYVEKHSVFPPATDEAHQAMGTIYNWTCGRHRYTKSFAPQWVNCAKSRKVWAKIAHYGENRSDYTRQTSKVTVDGVDYKSIRAAATAHGLTYDQGVRLHSLKILHDSSLWYRRLGKGVAKSQEITIDGWIYESVKDAMDDLGVSWDTMKKWRIRAALLQGYKKDEFVKVQEFNRSDVDWDLRGKTNLLFKGKVYTSAKNLAHHAKVDQGKVEELIYSGKVKVVA